MTVNDRVKELRKSLGLTLDKFGERVGVSRGAVSNVELGKRAVTEQMFKSICREFNVREEWLRDGIEPMRPTIDVFSQLSITDNQLKQIIINYFQMTPEDQKLLLSLTNRLANDGKS
ncbi:MAG: helix-turn-helix transcriptional regulator [Lachnospiraceae bacterium]|nr:helix-turn-helix transcriptional regulator [Lachnospiraceae bacterium]